METQSKTDSERTRSLVLGQRDYRWLSAADRRLLTGRGLLSGLAWLTEPTERAVKSAKAGAAAWGFDPYAGLAETSARLSLKSLSKAGRAKAQDASAALRFDAVGFTVGGGRAGDGLTVRRAASAAGLNRSADGSAQAGVFGLTDRLGQRPHAGFQGSRKGFTATATRRAYAANAVGFTADADGGYAVSVPKRAKRRGPSRAQARRAAARLKAAKRRYAARWAALRARALGPRLWLSAKATRADFRAASAGPEPSGQTFIGSAAPAFRPRLAGAAAAAWAKARAATAATAARLGSLMLRYRTGERAALARARAADFARWLAASAAAAKARGQGAPLSLAGRRALAPPLSAAERADSMKALRWLRAGFPARLRKAAAKAAKAAKADRPAAAPPEPRPAAAAVPWGAWLDAQAARFHAPAWLLAEIAARPLAYSADGLIYDAWLGADASAAAVYGRWGGRA